MPIPTDFNPLGSPFELPYIQPVMTGYDTWSNEPSFGCVVSGYSYAYPAWRVLKERSVGYSNWYTAHPTNPIVVRFERPIRLVRVEMAQRFASSGTANWIHLTGDGKTLVHFTDSELSWGANKYRWFTCANDVGYITQLNITYSYNGKSAQINPLVLEAYYRPDDLK